MINTSNGYFFLQNQATGLFFRPINSFDKSLIQQVPNTYNYTQWKKITTSENYFYLQNRATGKYFRPIENAVSSNLQQRPTTWSGNYTQWKFIDANAENKTNQFKLNSDLKQINLFPNPAKNQINILLESNVNNAEIIIINSNGKIVFREKTNDHIFQINTQGFIKGLYYIQIKTTNKTSIQKLILE